MIVGWDDRKAAANAKKHGVTFQEAATVLAHTLSITFRDPDHSRRSGWARSSEEFRFLRAYPYDGSHRPRGSRSANLGQASHAT